MTMLRRAGCALLCLLPSPAMAAGGRAPGEPAAAAAVVYALTGEAVLALPAAERRPLRLFERLPAGAAVEVGTGSRLALAFATGRRYELGERSRVTLGNADLSARSGPVRPLPAVPPLPRIAPIAEEDGAGPLAGAVRIRGERITGLYPNRWATALARATTLRFAPVAGAGRYRIEVHDRQGTRVFAIETASSETRLPPGFLRPRRRYDWTVRTVERAGPLARGEAGFVTLDRRTTAAREALRRTIEASGDATLLPLLADVDRRLGLWAEARDGLRAAVQISGDPLLAASLAEAREVWIAVSSTRFLPAGSAILCLLACPPVFAALVPESAEGAVVEEVDPGWAADQADLQPGDLLLSWSRGDRDGGLIRSPFDLGQLEIEQAPLGAVTLRGTRAGDHRRWVLSSGRWRLRARPAFPEPLLALYMLGRQRIAVGDLAAGAGHWRAAAETALRQNNPLPAAWLQARLSRELAGLGRWPEAEAALEQALRQLEENRPAAVAQLLRDWGRSETLASLRHDVGARAEALLRQALAGEPEESLAAAWDAGLLGRMACDREDYATAEILLRRAERIRAKLAPGSVGLAWTLQRELARIVFRRGHLTAQETILRESQEHQMRWAPESLEVALLLSDLGNSYAARGDLARADERLRRALALIERLSPDGPELATLLVRLGTVDRLRGDWALAARLEPTAPLWEKLAPKSFAAALSHLFASNSREGLDAESWERRNRKWSAEITRRALGIRVGPDGPHLKVPANHLGQVDRREVYLARAVEHFCRATEILERQRKKTAGTFESFGDPSDLRHPIADAFHECLAALLDVGRPAEAFRILERGRARATFDRPGTAHEPLDPAAVQAVLDPGTVLLSWSIGRERSFLFVVQPAGTDDGFEVFPLPWGERTLRPRIASLRHLLQRADSERTALTRQAQELYDLLLRPAEPQIAAARRLLVSPDSPLHTVPFAALVRDGRWLVEQKPVHTVLSATVYAEIRRSRRPGSEVPPTALAAFGDPLYPPLDLPPLPSTREEVEGIATHFPGARLLLGAAATEEQARSIGKDVRYLHFACHGLLDERVPLNSALALAIPEHPGEEQDDGLLQAWEIFESVRLDADLVTLSACDSALGPETDGEGLLGLTRAFQSAGARSVLASLWSVSDISTADLMKRFYGHLRAGKPKDEALQAAQLELIDSPAFSHPFHWAAFQLAGDWK